MSRSKLNLLFVILIGIILTLGVSGCMSKKPKEPTAEEIKIEVEKHLQEKYGEEFEPLSFTDSNWAYSYNKMYWAPKDKENAGGFEVRVVINKDGSRNISDGYFAKLIAPEYAKAVSGMVGEIYKDFEFFISFGEGVYPNRLNKDTKLEEVYSEDDKWILVSDSTVFVKEESASGINIEESLRTIASKMIEKKLVGNVRIYIVRNEKFDSITMDSLDAVNRSDYFLGDYKIVMIGADLQILALE